MSDDVTNPPDDGQTANSAASGGWQQAPDGTWYPTNPPGDWATASGGTPQTPPTDSTWQSPAASGTDATPQASTADWTPFPGTGGTTADASPATAPPGQPATRVHVLEFHEVRVEYGPVVAVEGFDGWVGNGEVVALLGSNGSGKSTLLKTASGLVRPASGRIGFCGEWIQHAKPSHIVKAGLVHVPQGRMTFPDQTVEANLLIGAHSRGRVTKAVRDDLDEILSRFPALERMRNRYAGTLSGGEQQMLAIARGLMARPRMLMLDEPSLGLAPIIQQQLMATLRQLADLGLGVLIVEQLAHLALEVADRAYVLDRGRLVAQGRPDEVRASGKLVEAYLGRDRA